MSNDITGGGSPINLGGAESVRSAAPATPSKPASSVGKPRGTVDSVVRETPANLIGSPGVVLTKHEHEAIGALKAGGLPPHLEARVAAKLAEHRVASNIAAPKMAKDLGRLIAAR